MAGLRASVVIPTYNRADLLRRQLTSLTRQRISSDAFEVVVADDGSSDGTREVVAGFADRLSLRYHFQEDLGFRVAQARNAGARLASGPILIFMDSGTLASPELVSRHLDAHRPYVAAPGRPGAFVVGCTYGYDPWNPFEGLGDLLEKSHPEDIVREYGQYAGFRDVRHDDFAEAEFDLRKFKAPWMYCWSGNLSVRTEDFWRAGGFFDGFRRWGGEDTEFGFRLVRDGVTPVASEDAWVVEIPHARDAVANDVSNQKNAWILWQRFPEPVTEIYGGIYGKGDWDPPLEFEYRELLDWATEARDLDVRAEVWTAVQEAFPRIASTGDAAGHVRVAVFGCGDTTEYAGALPGVEWSLIDFDSGLLDANADSSVRNTIHGMGIRTVLSDDAHDLAVISSRLRRMWPRWGQDILAEARRVSGAVRITFPSGLELPP